MLYSSIKFTVSFFVSSCYYICQLVMYVSRFPGNKFVFTKMTSGFCIVLHKMSHFNNPVRFPGNRDFQGSFQWCLCLFTLMFTMRAT